MVDRVVLTDLLCQRSLVLQMKNRLAGVRHGAAA